MSLRNRSDTVCAVRPTAPETQAHADPGGLFAVTQWSLILRARDKSEAALENLFKLYREPLLVWLRSNGYAPSDAEDLLHGFLQSFLRRDALQGVGCEKGKFRTFLLRCLKNHIRDEHDKNSAGKRGSGQTPASLNETDADGRALLDPASGQSAPDLEYDRAWANSVLNQSLAKLQQECANQGHAALWSALEPVLFADDTASPYREIAASLGSTEGAVKMAASRIRARLRGLVREQILQTVTGAEEWEDEIRYFIELFGEKH